MKRSILSILLILSAVSSAHALRFPPRFITTATVLTLQGGSHSVVLTWTQSPDGASVAYNVYRAMAGCTPAPTFTKLTSVGAGILTVTDTAVSAGQTLCYQVTGTLNGLEGSPSPSAQAVILPSPPPSLTLTAN